MTRLHVVSLDFGGTLGFGTESPPQLWQTFLNAIVGIEVAPPQIQQAWAKADSGFRFQSTVYHGPTDDFWLDYNRFILRELGIDSGEQQDLLSAINDAFQRHHWTFNLFPETREALDELRGQGYRLGVISNTTEEFPQVLAELELHWYFESVTYSAELGIEKPDHRIFDLAIQRMTCAPNEAVHVGDSYEKDIMGARAVGITPILIDREERYPKADCLRITDLRELPRVLSGTL